MFPSMVCRARNAVPVNTTTSSTYHIRVCLSDIDTSKLRMYICRCRRVKGLRCASLVLFHFGWRPREGRADDPPEPS